MSEETFCHLESFQTLQEDFRMWIKNAIRYIIHYSRLYFYPINAVLCWTGSIKRFAKSTPRLVTPHRTFSSSDRIDDPLPRAKRRSNRRLINIHGYRWTRCFGSSSDPDIKGYTLGENLYHRENRISRRFPRFCVA